MIPINENLQSPAYRVLRYCTFVCLSITLMLTSISGQADLARGNVAFAWVYQPTRLPDRIDTQPQPFYKSPDGVYFERVGIGDYRVTFAGFDRQGSGGGNVQLTPYFTEHHCQLVGWSAEFAVSVTCFDAGGTPIDANFLLLAVRPPAHGRDFLAYLWADQPTAARYEPNRNYSHNSAGGQISVTRNGRGRYVVEIGSDGVDADSIGGGNVQVTAYGRDMAYCTSHGWIAYSSPYTFRVNCFGNDGEPTDTRFSALVTVPGDDRSGTGMVASHDSFYQYNGGSGTVSVDELETGRYAVEFRGLGDESVLDPAGEATRIGPFAGHIQVGAVGSEAARCNAREWLTGRNTRIEVMCFDGRGDPARSDVSVLALFP